MSDINRRLNSPWSTHVSDLLERADVLSVATPSVRDSYNVDRSDNICRSAAAFNASARTSICTPYPFRTVVRARPALSDSRIELRLVGFRLCTV